MYMLYVCVRDSTPPVRRECLLILYRHTPPVRSDCLLIVYRYTPAVRPDCLLILYRYTPVGMLGTRARVARTSMKKMVHC